MMRLFLQLLMMALFRSVEANQCSADYACSVVVGLCTVLFVGIVILGCCSSCKSIRKRASLLRQGTLESDPAVAKPPTYGQATGRELSEEYRQTLLDYGFIKPSCKLVETTINVKPPSYKEAEGGGPVSNA